MDYKFEHIRDNGDATSNYNLKGEFPVVFDVLFKKILSFESSFRIQFGASNELFGGWLEKRLNIYKDTETGKSYFEDDESKEWYEEIKSLRVTRCWANGGYGQMLYIMTFEEEAEE